MHAPSQETDLEYHIGLMSGTSMDGVDAVCVCFENAHRSYIVAHCHLAYQPELKKALLALQEKSDNELHLSRLLARQVTAYYIAVVQKLRQLDKMRGIKPRAIGCHGQTIRHNPKAYYSIQLADWALLSEKTQLPVVGDFRASDIAAQGEGAPLVPAFHQFLFAHTERHRLILNIGGIANITVLSPNTPTFGFDTGPGNMLMDAWMHYIWGKDYDPEGTYARKGKICHQIYHALLDIDYLRQQPPKSTGRDLFSLEWLMPFLTGEENPHDVLRTLLEYTVRTISDAIKTHAPNTQDVFLCGGGAYNILLRHRLAEELSPITIKDTGDLGLPPQQVESAAFAWLAYCRIHGIPANLPEATGADGQRLLGALWQAFPLDIN